MRASSLLRLACTLACAGCGASFAGPPEVELGTGGDRFVAIHDGDTVAIVHGIQGGYHVWGAVRARYLDPRALRLRFTLALDDASAPLSVREDVGDLDGGDGSDPGTHAGTTVFLPDPAVARDHACRFTVEVTDADGRTAGDSRRIVPRGP